MAKDKNALWKEPIKDRPKITAKSAVVGFLEFLWNVADNFAGIADHGRHPQPFSQYNKKHYSSLIAQCNRQGYIIKNQESIELTNKAKLKIVDVIADSAEVDGKFRFISYDIPEKFRILRNKFRLAIKRMGFIQIQKSLWVCDKNVGEFVELATYEYKVEKYVAYIVSEKSDIDGIIKRKLREL